MIGQADLERVRGSLASGVVSRLRAAGHEAYLVGGCVRDLIMGRTPCDYDVATDARPPVVMKLFPRTCPVGVSFGVVLVLPDTPSTNERPVEVATFREDAEYLDHRRPTTVRFSTAESDSKRRDFTMNGLFLDPESGTVMDFVGGVDDIRGRLVRAIGAPAERFAEDALRVLRALRFAAGLEFRIDPATWDALLATAPTLAAISSERIRDELVKGLTQAHPDRFLRLMAESGCLRVVLPEIADMEGCTQPPEFHPEGDVLRHTEMVLANLPPSPPAELALAALLHDVGKPPTREVTDRIRFNQHHRVGAELAESIGRRLALSNHVRDQVVEMVLHHMDFMHIDRMRQSTLRRLLARPTIDMELALHRADCLASHGDLSNHETAARRLEELRAAAGGPVLPPPLIRGGDLKALGLKPGPVYKQVLTAVLDAQLEGAVRTRDDAFALVRRLIAEGA